VANDVSGVVGNSDNGAPDARLNRRDLGMASAEVRMLHLGLGAFHRAHQAWYTHVVNQFQDAVWGISAFTGRRPDEAEKLVPQDGLYTLVTRSPSSDSAEVIASISEVHAASEVEAWLDGFGNKRVTVVTITITEAGYCRNLDGGLDFHAPGISNDLAALLKDERSARSTAPGKLVQGLMERRRLDLGGMSIVSCDNLSSNGSITRRVVLDLCSAVDPALHDWVVANIRFPNTMVDRITPRTTLDDLAVAAELTGLRDESPVVTEPFHEWVIEKDFATARPEWELAGAQLVDDVRPHEQRKLLLLNGAHSLLAYCGLAAGLTTVAEAIADPESRSQVLRWWGEARELVELDAAQLDEYCDSLLDRWANPRIAHRLEQIAADGSLKLPLRVVPVIRYFRATGRIPAAAAVTVAGWMLHLRRGTLQGPDAELPRLPESSPTDAAIAALRILAPDLAEDVELQTVIAATFDRLLAASSAS
jgi:fructuronate reductase